MYGLHCRLLSALLSIVAMNVLGAVPVSAQVKTYKLEPKTIEGMGTGKFAGNKGAVGSDLHRFAVDQLDILQSVSIALHALNPDNPVNMTIHKFTWDEPERSLSTDSDGFTNVNFRAQGEFQIQLTSDGADAPYQLLVLVDELIRPVMTNAIVPRNEWARGQSGEQSNWMIMAAIVLLAAIFGVPVANCFRNARCRQ